MKLLAVETATDACSAALFIDGKVIERFELAPKEHTKLILPMIDGLMKEAGLNPCDLNALAFGCGPGSFTGVRIATGVIHGIALGAGLPVVPVSTLAALAQAYFNSGTENLAFVAMDARMGEIFWGAYRRNTDGYAELIGTEAVLPADGVDAPGGTGVGLGSAWDIYREALFARLPEPPSTVLADIHPRAGVIAQLGAYGYAKSLAVPVELAQPVYLRDKVAKTEAERRPS